MPDSRPPLTADPGPADPLARALAALQPAPPSLDGRALLYRAGQAAAGREVALWRWVVAIQFGLLLLVGGGAVALLAQADAVDRTTAPPTRTDPPAPNPVRPPGPEVDPAPRPAWTPPTSPAAPPEYAGPAADPDEIADYLRRRREVLTAGLGVLPDHGPKPPRTTGPAEVERSLGLPPGVLAAPVHPNPPVKPPE